MFASESNSASGGMALGWLVVILLLPTCIVAQESAKQYDLMLKGGEVIDPASGLHAVRDVAIRDHKIAAIEETISEKSAATVVSVKGMFVTPGLVDIHTHNYAGTGRKNAYDGDNSVYPDGFTFRSCVTTVVDAGSSGWKNFPDFKDRVIDRSKTRVLAFINIVGSGMGGGDVEQNVEDMDPESAAAIARKYPETIVGFKTAHFEGPEWTAVDRVLQAGKLARLPVMIDFGRFRHERPYQDLVTSKLRPGDISTHMYLDAVPMLDAKGNVLPYLFAARKRGVIFDVGHGGGSFIFSQAVPAIRQGFVPDSISTDLHIVSMNGGMKDMTNVMSKFLNMGMTMPDVVLRSTWNPAKEIHREELGNLKVGAVADVAVMRVETGKFGFTDVAGKRLDGDKKLVCELTVRDGAVAWDLNGISLEPWH